MKTTTLRWLRTLGIAILINIIIIVITIVAYKLITGKLPTTADVALTLASVAMTSLVSHEIEEEKE